MDNGVLVSIVMPVYNAGKFLDEAFQSIYCQTWKDSLEVSIFNDKSTDNSLEICNQWKEKFAHVGIRTIIGHNNGEDSGGVGYAKNQAIIQSRGDYLCFLDADDVMMENRIELQLQAATGTGDNCLIGSCYVRIPEGSTQRYVDWSNNLNEKQLYTQIYTSFGPTVINPTWFCSRKVFNQCGPFSEVQRGNPEDLLFFYKHLDSGGMVLKIDKPLLKYRYHENAATFSVHEDTIWDVRISQIEKNVLDKWSKFTIWNAGKQGRKFYRSLSPENRAKVSALCDVDPKKISKGFYTCELVKNSKNDVPPKIPILHFTQAIAPFIICVKLGMSNGAFEENLKSLGLVEGKDYFHFN